MASALRGAHAPCQSFKRGTLTLAATDLGARAGPHHAQGLTLLGSRRGAAPGRCAPGQRRRRRALGLLKEQAGHQEEDEPGRVHGPAAHRELRGACGSATQGMPAGAALIAQSQSCPAAGLPRAVLQSSPTLSSPAWGQARLVERQPERRELGEARQRQRQQRPQRHADRAQRHKQRRRGRALRARHEQRDVAAVHRPRAAWRAGRHALSRGEHEWEGLICGRAAAPCNASARSACASKHAEKAGSHWRPPPSQSVTPCMPLIAGAPHPGR